MDILNKRLLELREGSKLTQLRLARQLKISQPALNRYEHGESSVPSAALLAYADFFDVSADYLLGRCDEPRGKLYDFQPGYVKDQLKNSDEWRDFIEMCFDPNSPMSSRLKEMLFSLSEGEKR